MTVRLLNDEKYELFFNLAISQTLHKSAIHPIAVPYIVRSKKQVNCGHALDKFQSITKQMLEDLSTVPHNNRLAKVYNADSLLRLRTLIIWIMERFQKFILIFLS